MFISSCDMVAAKTASVTVCHNDHSLSEIQMLTALIGPVSNLLGKFIEDKDMKNKLAHEVATMAESHAQELAKGTDRY